MNSAGRSCPAEGIGSGIFRGIRVLLADATIQAGPGGSFTDIPGGYADPRTGRLKSHITAHLNGNQPAGGNLAMLDGHVEWRNFKDMQVRSSSGPSFWW